MSVAVLVVVVLAGCVKPVAAPLSQPAQGHSGVQHSSVQAEVVVHQELLAAATTLEDASVAAESEALIALLRALAHEPLSASARALALNVAQERLALASSAQEALAEQGQLAADRALQAGSQYRIARALRALRKEAYQEAIGIIEALRETELWPEAEPIWDEAVDSWVGSQREVLGQRFVASRDLPRPERIQELTAIRTALAALIDDYPNSAYVEPLMGNLERIERALEQGTMAP